MVILCKHNFTMLLRISRRSWGLKIIFNADVCTDVKQTEEKRLARKQRVQYKDNISFIIELTLPMA